MQRYAGPCAEGSTNLRATRATRAADIRTGAFPRHQPPPSGPGGDTSRGADGVLPEVRRHIHIWCIRGATQLAGTLATWRRQRTL